MATESTASHKPSWWKESDQGKWTPALEQAATAFGEVLGRGIAATSAEVAGLKNWANVVEDSGANEAKRLLSLSSEALHRGVDPAAYGNKVLDPGSLSAKDREWYDAWKESNSGPFYSGMLDQLHWSQKLYSVDVYRGMNDGTITVDANDVITVTPEAIERYGDGLEFFHGGSGQLIRAPEGDFRFGIQNRSVLSKPENWSQADWDEWSATQNSDGYVVYGTAADEKHGLGDAVAGGLEDLGLGSDAVDFVTAAVPATAALMGGAAPLAGAAVATAPMAAPFASDALGMGDQAYFLSDPLGATSGTYWGTEGARRNLSGGMDFFNTTDEERFQLAQSVGRGIVGTAAGLATGGLAGVAVGGTWSATQNINQAAAGMQSWGDAFTNIGIGTASSALMVDGGGAGAAFANAANSSVTGMLQTGLATGDWDAALEQGAVSGLSSLASAGFNAALRPANAGMGALYRSAGGMAAAYGAGELFGMEGDALENSAINAGIQGAIQGAALGSKPPGQDASMWAGVKDWATDWRLGNTPWGQSRIAGERVQAAREQRELRERFNVRGYREPSSFSFPDDWARDPMEGIGYATQGNFRLGA